MAKTVLFISCIAGITIIGDKYVCKWSNGQINIIRTMFICSDIGYFFTNYYGIKHYHNNNNNEKK